MGPAVAHFRCGRRGAPGQGRGSAHRDQGGAALSERHEAVLAALRIQLKGSAGKSLEEMLDAADDAPPDRLGEEMAKSEDKGKPSIDDLLGKQPKNRD